MIQAQSCKVLTSRFKCLSLSAIRSAINPWQIASMFSAAALLVPPRKRFMNGNIALVSETSLFGGINICSVISLMLDAFPFCALISVPNAALPMTSKVMFDVLSRMLTVLPLGTDSSSSMKRSKCLLIKGEKACSFVGVKTTA